MSLEEAGDTRNTHPTLLAVRDVSEVLFLCMHIGLVGHNDSRRSRLRPVLRRVCRGRNHRRPTPETNKPLVRVRARERRHQRARARLHVAAEREERDREAVYV